MGFTFDSAVPPIVKIVAEGVLDREQLTLFSDALRRDFDVTRPYVLLLDASMLKGMSFADRHAFGQDMKKFSETPSRYLTGTAIVVKSLAARGLIKALLWTAPPVRPVELLKDLDDATAWAHALIAKAASEPSAVPKRTLSQAFRID